MRINKLLSNYGYCSRVETNRFINDKRVIINGELAMPGQWVEETDIILLDGVPIKRKERIYIVLNKPVGITCTAAKDVKDNIIDYINYPEYIFPVGRLDKESQGLIIMTNDGELADKILNSENSHEKEYIVTVDKTIDNNFINGMSKGVKLGEKLTKPCKVNKIDNNTFRIILTEGLNKQIRKMTKTFGYTVIRLERIRIININIDGIEIGKWRNITDDELQELREYIK
ncbi:pseudouridine synthase [Clostridium sp. 'White wine YQ']|uniref:pseudouridine synthase n=1 Tax=Clostridium sp. 'White wine YQ' TaxID=3027474 RepID=UPI0023654F63|nr:pseudouridine synthase [Clostridium sp. 'White wine YQ']MDD7793898.1 pseudouridine synthase [Clostridium sp. 'White wine YQ']